MTTKTLLIAGGVVVGAFVLMRVLSPPPATVPRPTSSTSSLAGVIGAISGIGSAVGNIFGHSSGGGGASSNGGAYSDAASQTVLKNFDSSNYSVSNGFMFTDANGNFIAG